MIFEELSRFALKQSFQNLYFKNLSKILKNLLVFIDNIKKRAHWESNPGLRTRNPMHYHYAIRPFQNISQLYPFIQY